MLFYIHLLPGEGWNVVLPSSSIAEDPFTENSELLETPSFKTGVGRNVVLSASPGLGQLFYSHHLLPGVGWNIVLPDSSTARSRLEYCFTFITYCQE